jgi:hypothetical protein
MESRKVCLGLLRRRPCLVPTWRGWLLLTLAAAALALVTALRIGLFLAVTDPIPGGILVIEGWAPAYMIEVALAEFKSQRYDKLCVIGLPLEYGAPLSEYRNFAHIGAASLVKLGLSTNDVQAVPTGYIRRDRTYAMALSLKHWLRDNQLSATNVNVITGGAHARRSRLMFEKALGKGFTVGIISLSADEDEFRRWWHSSQGTRVVIGETIAYIYARVLFHPPEE